MTKFSGSNDSSDFHGNTTSLECADKGQLYISGLEVLKFKTGDKLITYTNLVGNNMCPSTITIGEKHIFHNRFSQIY